MVALTAFSLRYNFVTYFFLGEQAYDEAVQGDPD
jgi:hypothetical protein